MKRRILNVALLALLVILPACQTNAQLDWGRALSGGVKAVQAFTITDDQMAAYVKESVKQMDEKNPVAPAGNPYQQRLAKLTTNLKQVNGLPLNFKVYLVKDVNAFACPDGSVRVFSSLMDVMSDDELLGIIGHEIGHVALHHSKNAYKNALLTSAAKDALGATNSTVAALTDSQLGQLGESLLNASYSRKQENEADNYGYDFLKSHNINPLSMALSFKKLQQIESKSGQESGGYLQKMFSSHPDTQSRINNIEKRAKADGYTYPSQQQTQSAPAKTTPKKSTPKKK